MAIGSRGQSAKTYFEKHFSSFADASLDELCVHGLRALRETLQQDKELSVENVSIAYVSAKERQFTFTPDSKVQEFLTILESDPKPRARQEEPKEEGAPAAADAAEGSTSMAVEEDTKPAPMDVE